MNKRNIIIIVAVCLCMIAAITFAMGNKQIEQKTVVAGKVSQTIAVGTVVKSGDALISISTLTGTAPACRATVNGTVSQVLVNVGDIVTSGQVVVYIEEAGS